MDQTHEPNYVLSVQVPGGQTDRSMAFGTPPGPNRGSINIVCGPNAVGKSFILHSIARAINSFRGRSPESTTHAVSVRLSRPGGERPRLVHFGRSWRDKIHLGVVGIEKARFPAGTTDYSDVRLKLLHRHVAAHVPHPPTLDDWLATSACRVQTLLPLRGGARIFRCDATDPIVGTYERLTNTTLYFRYDRSSMTTSVKGQPGKVSDTVEFMARTGGTGNVVPFNNWSDGQQAVFAVLALVHTEAPDVLLIDEVENHLHPGFVSKVFEAIRAHPIQVIATTHHPHAVFSNLVDHVFFIDDLTPSSGDGDDQVLAYDRDRQFKPPVRRVVRMSSDFERVGSAYKLFDLQDAQLMRQAALVRDFSQLEVLRCLAAARGTTDIKAASKGPRADRQTLQLVEWLSDRTGQMSPGQKLKVFEIGAGYGRTIAEIAKTPDWMLPAEFDWSAWEPVRSVRETLASSVGGIPWMRVLERETDFEAHSADVSVIANVLHELTPDEFCDAVLLGNNAISRSGHILILEIFPLLHPEKLAVAYPGDVLQSILSTVGFVCARHAFSVYGSEAYVLSAQATGKAPSAEALLGAVKAAWSLLLRDSLMSWSQNVVGASMASRLRLLQDLTTVASINAYREGLWRRPDSRP